MSLEKALYLVGEIRLRKGSENMDRLTKEQRHKNMSNIKNKDTKIECTLRNALWRNGIRYRKNYNALPGKPDIVITKYKIAVFCDSEFFHGKDWETLKSVLKKGKNPDFWIEKIGKNILRDDEINKKLNFLGWTVIRFWGKDILKNTDECVQVIKEAISNVIINEGDGKYEKS